jgi:hypothetical protein
MAPSTAGELNVEDINAIDHFSVIISESPIPPAGTSSSSSQVIP